MEVKPLLDGAVGDALRHPNHQFFGAAAGGNHAYADLDEADVGLSAGLASCGVHGDFTAAAERHPGRSGDDGFGKVFHPHVGILEVRYEFFQDVPVAFL